MNRIITTIVALLISACLAFAVTIHVPGQYPTIQAGINAAEDGDTVLVAAGSYLEAINYLGKEIVVMSESGPEVTTIEWDQQHEDVVTFNSGEGPGAVLEGFTVTSIYTGQVSGSGVLCGQGTAPVIRGNVIRENGHWWSIGGGIYASGASPLIEANQIVENECCYYGSGIYLGGCSDVVITGNTIASNYTWSGYGVAKGGGIYATNSSALIAYNLIHNNIADPPYGDGGGGIALEDSGEYQVFNNTLSYNTSVMFGNGTGGGIYIGGLFGPAPVADVQNNIIVTSQGGGIAYTPTGPSQLTLDFNDVWNNTHFDYFGCLPGPFDISLDPQFVGGIPCSYELTEASPCIDAGSFTAALDPDGTRSDMGAFYFNQEGINVAIVTEEWPIIIPDAGGSFSYTIHLTNHAASATEFDVWVDVLLPDSTVFGPIILREGLAFEPNQHLQRDLTQGVPGGATGGTYVYMAHTGDHATGQIYHETLMPLYKQGAQGLTCDWILIPALDEWGRGTTVESLPNQYMSLKAAPNPFNPVTTIRYTLPGASHVSLKVYDLQGRHVAALVNGWRQAGDHELTFGGSDLASGLYLAVLESGNYRTVERLLLLK